MAVSHEDLTGQESPRQAADAPRLRDMVSQVQLEATLPPTPVRELLAASGATLYVLATDADFVAAIRRAAGDEHPMFVVERWADLMAAVESGRCGIALLDAAMLGSRVVACITTLATYADRVVALVAADRASAHQYIGFLSDGRLHRLLIKPPAVGATRLLIESATARCLQLRDESANDASHTIATAPARRFPTWGWVAAAGVAALAVLGSLFVGSRWDGFEVAESVGARAAVAAAPAAPPTPAERIAEHRAKAELARLEGRLAGTAGDDALAHYLAILAVAPSDEGARSGIAAVVDDLFTRAEAALLDESLAEAAEALDHVRRVDPASSRLAFLDAQLARALGGFSAAAGAPVEAPTAVAPTEIDSVLSLATARLRRGQLLTPAGDSARAYLDRATQLDAADPRVAALRADLAAALTAAARLVSGTDVTGATNLAAEARQLGAESSALAAIERDIGAARARLEQRRLAERIEAAQARVRSGALFAPAGESALDHLSVLQAEAPDSPLLAAAWADFRQAAVLAIETAIDRSDWALAETQLAGLARGPGGADAAAPLAAEVAAGRLQESYLATAAPASELALRSSVPVVYPPQAVQRGLEGWVDLEFVVDRAGQPQDLIVAQAAPPGRFDAAALTAVEQYRYVPFERDGRVYERRLRLRVRFQL